MSRFVHIMSAIERRRSHGTLVNSAQWLAAGTRKEHKAVRRAARARQAQAGGARQPRAALQQQRPHARVGEALPVCGASVVRADLADEADAGRGAQMGERLRHVRRTAAGNPVNGAVRFAERCLM